MFLHRWFFVFFGYIFNKGLLGYLYKSTFWSLPFYQFRWARYRLCNFSRRLVFLSELLKFKISGLGLFCIMDCQVKLYFVAALSYFFFFSIYCLSLYYFYSKESYQSSALFLLIHYAELKSGNYSAFGFWNRHKILNK